MNRTKAGTPRLRVAPGTPLRDRIKFHVRLDESGCWIWTAAKSSNGYGRIYLGKKLLFAHRASYEVFVGPIPDGLHLDHLCRNRACVNPAHLEPVTCLENVRRSPIHHASKASCPYGHGYTEANTYRWGRRRYCRSCQSTYMRIYHSLTPEERANRRAAGLPVVDLAAHFARERPDLAEPA